MHTCSHMYTRTCACTHTPYPNLGEPPAVQTLQLSTKSSPPSTFRSPHRRHLAKLRNKHLQGPLFLSSCALTRAHSSSASPGTNATNQVVCSAAPRPPGSCAHHWTAHSLGSGTVPAAPPGPDPGPPGPSKPLPNGGPAPGDPSLGRAATAGSSRKAACVSQAKQNRPGLRAESLHLQSCLPETGRTGLDVEPGWEPSQTCSAQAMPGQGGLPRLSGGPR